MELFDLEADPQEVENLALDRRGHSALLEEMNAKLNRLIDAEVGQDVGQMMPARVDGGWVATDATKDVRGRARAPLPPLALAALACPGP